MFLSNFYLKTKLSSGVVSLYSNRIIQGVADGLIGLFLPIFLFQKFNSIHLVLWFFLFYYLIYVLVVSLGAIIATKISFKRSLIFSVFAGTLYYVCLYFFDISPIFFIIMTLFFVNLGRMFYWVPYHSGFAMFTDRKNRGKVVAFLNSIYSLVSIFVPFVAGFILTQYGFNILFIIAIFIYIISVFPLLVTPKLGERYSFGYWETWRIFLHKRQRRMVLAYMADGAQDVVGIIIWPIFIWQLLQGDYQSVGLISSLVILFVVLVRLIMGDITDRFNKKKLMRWGTGLYSIGWLAKIFVQTGWHIFIVASYHSLALVVFHTPYSALMYEKAADLGHYVDEYTVLREMALNFGRVAMVLLMILLFLFVDIKFIFAFAAIASLFINLM